MALPDLTPGYATNLYVAMVLLGFVAVLAAYGLRSRPQLLLGVFLGFVAVNFLANGLLPSGSSFTRQVAVLTLALDPIYLLLFVTAFPYVRRPRNVNRLLMAVGGASALSAILVLLSPEATGLQFGYFVWERYFLLGMFGVAYAAAWVLALRAAVEAPTPSTVERAQWLASAVGLVIVTRLGLLPVDLGIYAWLQAQLRSSSWIIDSIPTLATFAIPVGLTTIAAYMLGVVAVRDGEGRTPAQLKRVFRFVRRGTVILFGAAILWIVLGGLGSGPYGLRWLVFAVLLTYGVLAYEVVGFRRVAHRIFPALGAWMAGSGAFLIILTAMTPGTDDATVLILATSAALGVAAPAGLATNWLLRRVERRQPTHESADRRLELYRAALESAWTTGPPDAETRKQLEKDRARFGLTHPEARALEHIVARSLQPARARLKVGDEPLPGIRITHHIADGGQGRVFEAHNHNTGEDVIIKEVRTSDDEGQLARRRILHELHTLEGLDHPRIVRLMGVRTPRAGYLLLYEKIDGQTLEERLRQPEKLTEPEVRRIATGLLEALEAAHQQGVVHRDIKPSNILLDRDGEPYLADFGIATLTTDPRDVKATVTNMDSLGVPVGTLAYMAPEQARGDPATPATDLYALGLVLYECLTGRPARDLRGQSLYQALDAIQHTAIALEALPHPWRTTLSQLLQPEPGKRPSRASRVIETINGLSTMAFPAKEARDDAPCPGTTGAG